MRKLTVLAITLLATLALSAASASAATTVTNEATGAACPALGAATHGAGSGGCVWHWTSNGTVEFGRVGAMVTCNWEYTVRISFPFIIGTKTLTNCNTPTTPCSEAAGEDVWPGQLNGEANLEISLCVIAFGFTNQCTIENLSISESAGHVATLATPDGANHTDCDEFNGGTLSGSWTSESGGAGEVEAEIVD